MVWEFRQITAMEEELKTGKPAAESQQTFIDDSYGEYLRSLGISPELMEAHGLNSHGQQ